MWHDRQAYAGGGVEVEVVEAGTVEEDSSLFACLPGSSVAWCALLPHLALFPERLVFGTGQFSM